MKFRKKPLVIEAIQFDGTDQSLTNIVLKFNCACSRPWPSKTELRIVTLEGVMTALIGDWIVKGIKGEFYPCKPDIFEATYDAVEE